MRETSFQGDKHSGARPTRLRLSAHKAQERRRAELVSGGMLIFAIAAAILVTEAGAGFQ